MPYVRPDTHKGSHLLYQHCSSSLQCRFALTILLLKFRQVICILDNMFIFQGFHKRSLQWLSYQLVCHVKWGTVASSDVCTACCDGVQTACGILSIKASLKLLSLWADHLNRLLMGTSFASIWLVLTGSSLLLARAISHELFLASFSFPHSFYVSFTEWFYCILFF